MSIKLMSAIWDNGPDKQAERFVLLALADYANDKGECWPSVVTVAKKTCLSERGVRLVLRALEAGGWLITDLGGGRGGANIYRIKGERGAPPRNVVPPERGAPPRNETTLKGERGAPEPLGTTIKKDRDKSLSDRFEEFWQIVPRKAAKEKARQSFAKATRSVPPETIITAMRRYADQRKGQDPQFTAHPASWLNAGRWTDEPEQIPTIGAGNDRNSKGDRFMRSFLAGATDTPRMDTGQNFDPPRPLLARG